MIDTEDASLKNVRFYTTEKLSGKTARTPEGFLLCTDVVIARTGQQLYAPGETPVEPGPDGIVKIEREAAEVFRPETMASFNGKPLVNEHPDEDVTPANWKYLSIGVVMSPRRGTGTQDDLLLADLLITDENGIEEVLEGKRELSCGYDCDYDQYEPGHGRQYNIIGNHVALVHSARCGSRCSIRDSAANGGEMEKKCFKDKIRELFKTKDSKPEQLEELLKDVRTADEEGAGGGGIHLHMASGGSGEGNRSKYTDEKLDELFAKYDKQHESHDSRLKAHDEDIKALRGNGEGEEEEEKEGKGKSNEKADKEIEGELEEEAPEGTGDKARKAKDSAYLVDSFQETVAAAEILAPGIKVPTFDKAAKPLESYTNICKFRAKVLGKALEDEETAELIKQANRGKTLDAASLKTMDCSALRTLFFASAAIKKSVNNSSRTNDDEIRTAGGGLGVRSKMKSPADLNKRNQEFYSRTH